MNLLPSIWAPLDGAGGKKLYVEIIGVPAYFAFSGICRDVHLLYITHHNT
jgi:hypothetical protein